MQNVPGILTLLFVTILFSCNRSPSSPRCLASERKTVSVLSDDVDKTRNLILGSSASMRRTPDSSVICLDDHYVFELEERRWVMISNSSESFSPSLDKQITSTFVQAIKLNERSSAVFSQEIFVDSKSFKPVRKKDALMLRFPEQDGDLNKLIEYLKSRKLEYRVHQFGDERPSQITVTSHTDIGR